MAYAFSPPPQAAVPITGSDLLFPVHRVYCIGRNYADHAREMGHDPDREPPFFFQKNPDSLRADGIFPYPAASVDVQFEVELAVFLKSGGRNVPAGSAADCIFGYGVALDMTRRDLQAAAKKLGRPWDTAKAFEHSAPCSPIMPAVVVGHPASGSIWLDCNGVRHQSGDLRHMIWSVPEQIAEVSRFFTLAAGDVILTGTPAGVGPVARGDRLEGGVEGIAQLAVAVV